MTETDVYNRYKVSKLALLSQRQSKILSYEQRNVTNERLTCEISDQESATWHSTMAVLSRMRAFIRMYPVTRGMISYATIWPTSCLIQQTIIEGKNYTNYNYWAALRFSIYGGLFTAPTLYCWIRVATFMWPKTSIRTAVTKAFVEQLTYGPAALTCFFFGMTLLEGRGFHAATHEVSEKFWPSYKVAVCVWPILQTINFGYIRERNRVMFASMCSLMWTSFLAYMHHLKAASPQTAPQSALLVKPPISNEKLLKLQRKREQLNKRIEATQLKLKAKWEKYRQALIKLRDK